MPMTTDRNQVQDYCNRRWRCEHCGAEHVVPTRRVVIGPGAIRELPEVLDELELGRKVHLLADENTFSAAGEKAADVLAAAGFSTQKTILTGAVHADEHELERLRRELDGNADCLCSVGAGTINDLGKRIALEKKKPFVSVATAASMNGYGSPIAAVMDQGVKITLEAAPTAAIVADLDVLTAAPVRMARAGVADLLGKPVANSDWQLSHALTGSPPFCPVPMTMLDDAIAQLEAHADGVGRSETEAIRELIEALIISGFSMTVAGHSSPASGGEHFISHYWDMQAVAQGREHDLHGLQVGLGTLLTATLYERLRNYDPDRIDVKALAEASPDRKTWESRLRRAHGPLFEAVLPEAEKKFMTGPQRKALLTRIKRQWQDLWSVLGERLVSAESIRAVFRRAGVPLRGEELGLTRPQVKHALLHARDLRKRFTVLDLAAELGVLSDWADSVTAASGVA